MVKRSEQEWRELFETQARSGLSASAFCRQRKLCVKHFCKRRRQLSGGGEKRLAPAFVPARVKPVAAVIEVRTGAVRLQLPVGVPARWLAELVQGLNG